MYPNQPQQPPQPQGPPPAPTPPEAYPPYPPQQPTQQPPANLTPHGMSSIDYLNQIAAPQKTTLGFSRKQIAILGSALLLAFGILAAFMLTSAGPDITRQSQQLAARASSLEDTVKESQKNIKNSRLANINTGLSVQLTSANTALTKELASVGVNTSKIDQSILALESNSELMKTLDNARLHGNFDDVYVRETQLQLRKTILLMESIANKTNSASLKKSLEDSISNLEPLHQQLSDHNNVNG